MIAGRPSAGGRLASGRTPPGGRSASDGGAPRRWPSRSSAPASRPAVGRRASLPRCARACTVGRCLRRPAARVTLAGEIAATSRQSMSLALCHMSTSAQRSRLMTLAAWAVQPRLWRLVGDALGIGCRRCGLGHPRRRFRSCGPHIRIVAREWGAPSCLCDEVKYYAPCVPSPPLPGPSRPGVRLNRRLAHV